MTLLEQWRNKAYDQNGDRGAIKKLWTNYFNEEKRVYKILLATPDEVVSGTVKELAEKFSLTVEFMVAFLDGINDSLKEPNPIETMDENTTVQLGFDKETLYKNMVYNEADWLYNLPEWNNIFEEAKRKQLYREQKLSTTVKNEEKKVYPNDPCPCGSGKKYKKCCMNK
ncbi:MAG: SEC-C domain-containing protein [Lachnospiraceae bacterium]|nr:SEC-C domain-containing protein [Lachnospiraceae bacterium]